MISEMWIFSLVFWIVIALFIVVSWSESIAIARGKEKPHIFFELLPFMWIFALYISFFFAVVQSIRSEGEPLAIVVNYILALWYVWETRHWYKKWKKDHDHRWKKRAKKALGAVQVAGHKLVVVHETAEVRA